jgi:hypothetical protein
MTYAPTNSDPADVAVVASALAQAMRDADSVQAQGSFGVALVAESTQQPVIGAMVSVT